MNLWGTSSWWPSRRLSHTLGPRLSTCSSSSWSAWRRRNWYVSGVPHGCSALSTSPLLKLFLESPTNCFLFLAKLPAFLPPWAPVVCFPQELRHCCLCPDLMKRVPQGFSITSYGSSPKCFSLPQPKELRGENRSPPGSASVVPFLGLGMPFAWEQWITDVFVVRYLNDTGSRRKMEKLPQECWQLLWCLKCPPIATEIFLTSGKSVLTSVV